MIELLSTLKSSSLVLAVGAIAAYTIYGAIYRLYFSPVAGFPGPRLAALTLWYEFYYEVFPHRGRFTSKIASLHEKYGPIVRVNPWELHISTPQFYDTLYSPTGRLDKWTFYTRAFGTDGAGFSTADSNLHRMRRAGTAPYFSTANIRRIQPVIEAKLSRYLERLRGLMSSGETVRMVVTASAFSTDVVKMYCYGTCDDRVEMPDFDANEYDALHGFASALWVLKHNYWIILIIRALPATWMMHLPGPIGDSVRANWKYQKQIHEILTQKSSDHKHLAHRTIFHELLESDMPAEEKSIQRLAEEAEVIVNAGGETIAWTLTVISYHLLANPSILKKLKAELLAAIPDPDTSPELAVIEQLPYLTAVVREGLRLGYGISSRLVRIPLEPLTFKASDREWVIPAGTPCGMTSSLVHHDEDIFPDSHSFIPERWIDNPALYRYLVSFSKGTRGCVGKALAYAELYLWISSVFRRFGSKEARFAGDEGILALVDTDVSDVAIATDMYVPEVKKGSKGVRFRVLP